MALYQSKTLYNWNMEIKPKIKEKFNKTWKKITQESAYQNYETANTNDLKVISPLFVFSNQWFFPKEHTSDSICLLTNLIHEIVGNKYYTWSTVYAAIQDEIRLFFNAELKQKNEWYLDHLLNSIALKNKKRILIHSISGLNLDGFEGIHRNVWKHIRFNEDDVENFSGRDSGDDKWKNDIKKHLLERYKDKVCIVLEVKGDLETAKKEAYKIASFIVNTFRYFMCYHLSNTQRIHDVGIKLDSSKTNQASSIFSFDTENIASTMSFGDHILRQEYPLNKLNFDVIKNQMNADKLWNLYEKDKRNDLESSIISSVTWIGDAHQEEDINSSYIKYWISIEALLIGHNKNSDITPRIKNIIPVMVSHYSHHIPTRGEIDKAYNLRCKVVHCGAQDIIKPYDLNKVCVWAILCLRVCMHLLNKGYTSREQIEIQTNKINEKKDK
jgi:hypothetical protein